MREAGDGSRSAGRRPWSGLRAATDALIALAAIPLLSGCDAYFFYPRKDHLPNPGLARVARKDMAVTAPDGVRLHGWVLSPPAGGKVLGTVLFLHGNAENVSTYVDGVLWLALAGYRVVLVDYRGYGMSEGRPSMEGIHADARAALDAVFAMEGVDRDRVLVLGQSLGGAVAVHAVVHSPHKFRIRALVIDSAFAGYREIAREKVGAVAVVRMLRRPLSWLVTDRFSPRLWIGRVSPVPLLVIHGDADRVVPPRHGEALYSLAGEPKELWIVPGAGHIRSFASAEVRQRLLAYLSRILDGRPGERGSPDRPEIRRRAPAPAAARRFFAEGID